VEQKAAIITPKRITTKCWSMEA